MRLFKLFSGVCLVFAWTGAMAAPQSNSPQNQHQAAAQALADVCAKVACRKITTTLILRKEDGSTGEVDTSPFPYFDPDGEIFIYPGESIILGVAKNGSGRPRLLKAVDAGGTHQFAQLAAGEASLEFQFRQLEGKPDMVLSVQNATSAMIKYDALMVTAPGRRPSPTSSCPVYPPQPGQASFGGIESWPHPIVSLLITNIRPLGKSDPRTCI
jgi:hypothetical protein